MTLEELEEWLESARHIASHSGQRIGDYEVIAFDGPITDARIDHGDNALRLS